MLPTEITLTRKKLESGMESIESVVAITLAVLAAVFLGSLALLVVVCRHKICQNKDGYLKEDLSKSPNERLISCDIPELELGEVCLHPNIENILADSRWVDDATGLLPHCLAVMKSCHQLTEKLAELTMGPLHHTHAWEITEVARRISPRVDDVVRCLYPPLDARVLEARCFALVMAVTHLALVVRNCKLSSPSWIDQSLAEMDQHLLFLRESALLQEAAVRVHDAIGSRASTPS